MSRLDGVNERADQRAADADRERIAAVLQTALNEGRLTLTEYDDRLREAYLAKTYGELDTLVADLPTVPPAERQAVATVGAVPAAVGDEPSRRRIPPWLKIVWGSWLTATLVTNAIWVITVVSSGELRYYWPIWVMGPWGAVLLAKTISGEGRREAERRELKERKRRELKGSEQGRRELEGEERREG